MFTFYSKMNIKHKVLSCGETGEDCLAVVAYDRVDANVMREVFTSVAEITESVGACRVLIDLREGAYSMTWFEMYRLFNEIDPAMRLRKNRIALLSAPNIEQYDRLFILSVYLLNQGVESVFYQINRAVVWLGQNSNPPIQH